MKPYDAELAPYPAQCWAMAPLRAAALAKGKIDLVNLWSGQSAALLRHRKADELFASLVQETEEIFKTRFVDKSAA
jgi:nitronate monooxygenase